MYLSNRNAGWLACTVLLLCGVVSAQAQQIEMLQKKQDPYGFPRPGRGEENVALLTSFYFELAMKDQPSADTVLPESVQVELQPEGGPVIRILEQGREFAPGYSGKLFTRKNRWGNFSLAVYVDSRSPLNPSTRYTVRVSARSKDGAELSKKAGTWPFTTEVAAAVQAARFDLNLDAKPVQWHGAFFSGFCKPSFATSHSNRIPGYELMDQVRKRNPKAWSLQRDFTLTGMEHQPKFLSGNLANAVRELETRRITKIQEQADGRLLHLEDFFGHQQYGIPSDRPLSEDYHPGDEVLIADGLQDARAEVLAVDDSKRTVLVNRLDPPDGWKLQYAGPLPSHENPDAPGMFPPGGCYLRKFSPSGTPRYYWGRIDKEWDLVFGRFGRRLMPNFVDAPGDMSLDGRNFTTAKDYVKLHEAVMEITGHLIDRYGEPSLDFVWSVFNEPDLMGHFWRSDWDELQKFYDYTVDGILRAFEDRGYDSDRVFVGGLELGAIFGIHLRIGEFLAHCSPTAQAEGALPKNAAFADRRLDGKRSKRVEKLCLAHQGKGTPCDFVSVHSYNRSEMTAAKLARAKEIALEIDPEYYARLWVNSHETCPDWAPPPDPAAADSYLGNGYFPTWCADVARRQLQRAEEDPRFAFGETILTFWPWPNSNFGGANACTRVIRVDDDGDGLEDRTVTITMPIFHFIDLLTGMGDDCLVMPEQVAGSHVLSGFASPTDDELRVLLYTHHALDVQSRSGAEFDFTVKMAGLRWPRVAVREYRFDKDHNSYFRLGRELRDGTSAGDATTSGGKPGGAGGELDATIRALESEDRETVLVALKKLGSFGRDASSALGPMVNLVQSTQDEAVRSVAIAAATRITAKECYHADTIKEVEALASLSASGTYSHKVNSDGTLDLTVRVSGNGVNFLVIGPDSDQ